MAAEPVSKKGDEVVARLERLPVRAFYLRLFPLLGVGTFFDAYDSLAIGGVLAVIISIMHLNLVQSGTLISVAYVGQFFGAFFFGYVSERYGRKVAFITSLMLFGGFSLGAAFAWDYNSLFAFRLLQGLGIGGEVPIAGAMMNEFVRGKVRGWLVIVYENNFSIGMILPSLVLAGLVFLVGGALAWRLQLVLGFFPFLWACLCIKLLPESPRWLVDKGKIDEADKIVSDAEQRLEKKGVQLPPPDIKARADVQKTRFLEIFSREYLRRTAFCWSEWFCAYFNTYGWTPFMPVIYTRVAHVPLTLSLVLTAIPAIINLPWGYIYPYFLDIWGRKPFAVGFFLGNAATTLVGFLLVSIYHTVDWPIILAIAIFMQLTNNNTGLVYVWTPESFPTRMRAWATATGSAMNRLASVISPIAVGILLAGTGGLGSVWLMFAFVALVGAAVVGVLGIETKRRSLEEISGQKLKQT